jgi:RHS repeat-associated protein
MLSITDYGYTGQRDNSYIKLMDYDFRWYNPELARFVSPDSIVPNIANPQSLNRYSYVVNRPINFNDPTGHDYCDFIDNRNRDDCDSGLSRIASNRNRKYSPSEKEHFPSKGEENCVPAPGQWLCDLNVLTEDSSHYYELTNIVCPASWKCTEKEMIYYLSLFAYPGQNPFNGPALPNTNYSVRPPFGSFSWVPPIYNLGLIQVSTRDGGLTSINTTMKSHIFCCGTVERTLTQDPGGAWIVTTVGSGSNSSSFTVGLNNSAGPVLFDSMDSHMLSYILDKKFPDITAPPPPW